MEGTVPFVEKPGIPLGNTDSRALRHEPLCDCGADARTAARDERSFLPVSSLTSPLVKKRELVCRSAP